MRAPRKTVFLDRDGVLNRRILGDYVTSPAEFQLLDGVCRAVAALNRAGFRTVVVTNQRGIAIGRMTRADVDRVHELLSAGVHASGGCLDEFYVCPHDRDDGCVCRKPRAGLLDQADAATPVDFAASFLIGDSDTDILAGKARGVTTIKVAGPSEADPDYLAEDLPVAVDIILARNTADS